MMIAIWIFGSMVLIFIVVALFRMLLDFTMSYSDSWWALPLYMAIGVPLALGCVGAIVISSGYVFGVFQ